MMGVEPASVRVCVNIFKHEYLHNQQADRNTILSEASLETSVTWITPEIRRKIRKKNATHAKAKKTGSAKTRSKFET